MPYVGVNNGETWMIAGHSNSKYLEGEDHKFVHMLDAQLQKMEF